MIVWYGRRPGSTRPETAEAGSAILENDPGAGSDDP